MGGPPSTNGHLLCPSAQPDMDDAVAFGVIGGSADAPRVQYLRRPLPVVPELLALADPVEATEVFRFAAPCAESACQHYQDHRCQLASRVTALIEGSSFGVPRCGIRPRCRWWREQGVAACHRCPVIVTKRYAASPLMRDAAGPVPTPHAEGAP
jgi:hypothetical protein